MRDFDALGMYGHINNLHYKISKPRNESVSRELEQDIIHLGDLLNEFLDASESEVSADAQWWADIEYDISMRIEEVVGIAQNEEEAGVWVKAETAAIKHCFDSPQRKELASSMSEQSKPYRCNKISPSTGKPCDTAFARRTAWTRHENTIHNPPKEAIICKICPWIEFNRRDSLLRHSRRHHAHD